MKIAVNTVHLLKNKLEGIGWFAHETLSRIVRNHPEHEFLFIFDRPCDSSFIYANNVKPVATKIPSRHPFLWYWHFENDIPKILKEHQADVFFSPDGWMSLKTEIPTVDTIHDINFIHRPNDFPFLTRKYYNHFFPKFATKSNRIITVSEYSKNDICKSLQIPEAKIDVAYNGCNSSFAPIENEIKTEIRKRYTNGEPYFVYVGSINPRKNIKGLLEAFEMFKQKTGSKYKLVFIGKPMWGNGKIGEQLETMKSKPDVVFTGRLSLEVLHMVLAAAEALSMVSFSEGFGIPILEAMNCDVPVICSNITSMPEVAGDAARYIDPHNPRSIAAAFREIAENKELSKALISKGRIQRQKFSWDKTAEAVWNSIEKASEG